MRHLGLVLAVTILPTTAQAVAPPDPVHQAVARSLVRLRQGATNYISNRQCFSCHHQTLAIASFQSAKRRGFRVSQEFLQEQTAYTLDTFRPKLEDVRKGNNVGGRNTTVAYALHTLQLAGHPADEVTEALIDFLLVRQEKDGSWPAVTQRVPSEGSKFSNAALALATLKHYAPPDHDRTKQDRRRQIETARDKAIQWLHRARPGDTEDQVFRLRALLESGAERSLVEEAIRELVKQQLPAGSWRQTPTREGDAYATATVLLGLRYAGMPTTDPVYQRGVAYLLRTQTPEGAWIVTTRNKPIQRWFDNGDPGGKHQFISFLATGWATLALLETLPETNSVTAR